MNQIKNNSHSGNFTIPTFGEVNFKFIIKEHDEAPHTWVITGAVVSGQTQIGSIETLLFVKDRMRGNFHKIMDIHSEETQHLATSIFNPEGTVRSCLLSNDVKKGSGVWGAELNKGNFLLIESVQIAPEFRKRGIGHWLLSHTLQIPEIDSNCQFVFACPVNLDDDCSDSEYDTRCELVLKFFHDAGFRRVGRTNFLGYALKDSLHPSRSLSADQDPHLQNDFEEPSSEEILSRYPLHSIIASKPQNEAIEFLQVYFAADPLSIVQPDFAGNTPLHIASVMGKEQVVCQILQIAGPQAAYKTNLDGLTPLEQLNADILSIKEFCKTMLSGKPYSGVENEKCMILYELTKVMNKPLPSGEYGEQQWMAFKWGCTCGRCQGGWLSPRMKYRLRLCAEVAADRIREEDLPARIVITQDDLISVPMSDYIPAGIRRSGVYSSYIKGYGKIFEAIAKVLQADSNTLHTKEAVKQQLLAANQQRADRDIIEYYFHNGGTIDHAISAVIHRSWEEGPEGDNSLEEIEEFKTELSELPECTNDNSHSIVCQRLELPIFKENLFDSDDDNNDIQMEDDEDRMLRNIMMAQRQ